VTRDVPQVGDAPRTDPGVTVLDASAVLAFLLGEPGADTVELALGSGAVVGAANWSEVAQKVIAAGVDWSVAAALLDSFETTVVPVDRDDADWAASRWRRGEGLSLGDRLCLALGHRFAAPVLTADRQWRKIEGVTLVR
jgi:ribonuclease VapC